MDLDNVFVTFLVFYHYLKQSDPSLRRLHKEFNGITFKIFLTFLNALQMTLLKKMPVRLSSTLASPKLVWGDEWWCHDMIMTWQWFPHYWPYVRGIHGSLLDSADKGPVTVTLIFPLLLAWISCWTNRRVVSAFRWHDAHVISPWCTIWLVQLIAQTSNNGQNKYQEPNFFFHITHCIRVRPNLFCVIGVRS